MTGWDTSCDSEPYFDSMQTTGRSVVVHLPRDAAGQQVHAKLSLLLLPRTGVPLPHVYDKENLSIAQQIVTDLLLRWSQSAAPPVASTAPRKHALSVVMVAHFKQTRNRSSTQQLDYTCMCTAKRQTTPSMMMVGSPRNLQGYCLHHTPVGVFESCGDLWDLCVPRDAHPCEQKQDSEWKFSLTVF